MSLTSVIGKVYRTFLPVSVRKFIYEWRHPKSNDAPVWSGNYPTWEAASKECTGYDSKSILEKVKAAAVKVKNGEAAFERDSVLFKEEEYNEGFLKVLDLLRSENNSMKLIDFGGSLGSVYFQYKKKLHGLTELKWCVIEQTHFVDFGKTTLQTENLKFYYSIEDCLKENKMDAILFSSVLSYVEFPYEMIELAKKKEFNYLIIDRTLFSDKEIIVKQDVPEAIYKASYPCRILNKDKIVNFMSDKYSLIMEFDPYENVTIAINGKTARFTGLVFKLKK